ncbi:MAG: CTP synthetase [Paracoccaceae bacterium]
MLRLFLILYTLAATTLAGSAIIAALTMNLFDLRSIIVAAAAGAAVAVPVAWIVAKQILAT